MFILPETLRFKHDLNQKDGDLGCSAPKKSTHHVFDNMKKIFLPMFSMITEPAVVLITLYNTVVYASLYVLVGCIYFIH